MVGPQLIRVDASRFRPEVVMAALSDSKGLATEWLEDMSAAAYAEWVRLAQNKLRTTMIDYLTGLQSPEIGEKVATISLLGVLPNLVEQGMDATDLRQTLCWNVNAKNRKPIRDKSGFITGYYNTIPFRHGTPGSTGISFPAMGSAYGQPGSHSLAEVQGRTILSREGVRSLAKNIYSEAKQLAPTTRFSRTATTWGARLPAGLAPKLKAHHATDIYAGMVRQIAAYRSAVQAQYMTFRRISTNSTTGWLHPGIEARQLHRKVDEYLGEIGGDAFSAILQRRMG